MFYHVGSCLGQVLGTGLLYYGGKDTPPMVCIFFGGFTFILLKRTNCQSGLYTTFTQVHDFKERIPLFKSNGSELNDTQDRIGLIKDVRMIFCMVGTFITSLVFSTTLLLLSPYICNVNHLASFDRMYFLLKTEILFKTDKPSLFVVHSIIITVFSLANPFICYTSNKVY
jgi:hypothetical protein